VAGAVGWFLGRQAVSSAAVAVETPESPQVERTRTDPLFAEPEDLGKYLRDAERSTVTVFCTDGVGAGWIIDTTAEALVRPKMRDEYGSDYPQTVVTAEHVIRDCRKENKPVRVKVGGVTVPSVLMNWNRERDVATIGIASNSPAASPFTFTPDGTWAMTIGAPLDDVLVPVIGQVVHDDGFDLLLHLTTRPGNSGGPVFNSRGEVIGTIGGTILDEETGGVTGWSYAAPVEALCDGLFECSSMGIDAS
jgi:S1-C subfamily serine protease